VAVAVTSAIVVPAVVSAAVAAVAAFSVRV
jgi:hypothetical protein